MSRSGRTLATVVVVALSSWSCGSTAPDATSEVASIVVSPASSTLALNGRLPLEAQVQDESGALVPDAAVTWTVEKPDIISISAEGVVTALAVGTSKVAANALGKSGLATITVNPASVNPGTGNSGGGNSGGGNSGGGNSGGGNSGGGNQGGGNQGGGNQGGGNQGEAAVSPGAVATVTVTAPSNKVKPGSTMQLAATAKDNKGTTVPNQSFSWSSSSTNTATVSASGVVTGKRKGNVTITARTSGGKSGSLHINVK